MTVAQLIQRVKDLAAFDLSNFLMTTDGTISDANVVIQLNEAQRRISTRIEQFDHSIVTTLVDGTANYDLRNTAVFAKAIVKPLFVVINGNPLYDASGRDFGMWSLNELQRANPNFRSDTAGTPTRACWYGNTKMTLNAPPSAAVVSAARNYVAGTYLPSDMNASLTSATPDLPVELHEALAVKTTVWAAISATSKAEGWTRLKALDAWADETIERVRDENISNLNDWGSTQGYHIPDYMYT